MDGVGGVMKRDMGFPHPISNNLLALHHSPGATSAHSSGSDTDPLRNFHRRFIHIHPGPLRVLEPSDYHEPMAAADDVDPCIVKVEPAQHSVMAPVAWSALHREF